MAATMNDIQREREILEEELINSRFAFAESLKSGLGENIKKELNAKKEKRETKKIKKESFIKRFFKKLSYICKQ